MNEEQKPLEPTYRVVRGQTLREMNEDELEALHAQLLTELKPLLDSDAKIPGALSNELELVEIELWQRT